MLYEIFAIGYILWDILVYILQPVEIMKEWINGVKYVEKDPSWKIIGTVFFALFYLLFNIFFFLVVFIWTARKGIIFANYYLILGVGIILFGLVTMKRSKGIKDGEVFSFKKAGWIARTRETILTILEIGILLYAMLI